MKLSIFSLSAAIVAGALAPIGAQAHERPAPPGGQTDPQAADADQGKDIIVTGVFSAKRIENAPIAISAVTSEEIAQQNPVNAADILKNVPGVFVNTSLGEIRSVVFSRGVSANSLDGASGYFYVSLQEDGLPVESVTATNFGPDYFTRPDIMVDHVEALRGGTATVTGANAPGGIFNYITRTGKSHPGTELSTRLGLEGDGNSPYYRGDAYSGGKLTDNLYYAIGGFYRYSDGAHDPGYAMNRGGQVRANLLWDYGSGSLLIHGKYLDDRNGIFEFTPAVNYDNPKIAPGFTAESSVLPPAGAHSFTNADGSTGSFDPSDLVHSRSLAFGANWEQDGGDGFHISNRIQYSRNRTDWNTSSLVFPGSLTDIAAYLIPGLIGYPGELVLRNRADGSIAAEVQSLTGFDHTVTVNNLPNSTW